MKNRIITTLLVIVCVLSLAACGGASETVTVPAELELTDEQRQQWYDSASQFVLAMNEAVKTGQAEAQMDDPVYGPAFSGWENALRDIGEVQDIEGKSCTFTKKDGTVTVRVKGSRHDADVVFTMESADQAYVVTAITTNVVAAGSAPLTRAHINTLVATMADNGAPFKNAVIFGNSAVKQSITALYGTTPLGAAPQSRNVGGLDIQTIVTDFGEIGVVYDRFVPAGTLLIADLAFVTPVSLAVPGKGHMFYEPLSKTGAGESGQFYGQIGLAYGPEVFHGKITGISGTTDPSQAVSINASSMSVAADAMTVTTDAVTVNQASGGGD